jgi:hypothetical protein
MQAAAIVAVMVRGFAPETQRPFFKGSSAASIPRLALSVRAVGCSFDSKTSFSAFSSHMAVAVGPFSR